jgi:hypothetical protein
LPIPPSPIGRIFEPYSIGGQAAAGDRQHDGTRKESQMVTVHIVEATRRQSSAFASFLAVGFWMTTAALIAFSSLAAPLFAAASDVHPSVTLGGNGGLLVFHQITDLVEESEFIASPVLSAGGTRAAFGFGIDDPENGTYGWNRIYVVNADGSGLTKVDDYERNLFTEPMVDISADGGTVVSTDKVRLRIADGNGARELLALEDGNLMAVRISGDGRTVFFVIDADTDTVDDQELGRGVWAIDVDGGHLRQLVGGEDIAAFLGLPIEATWLPGMEEVHACCFAKGFEEHGLAVSHDGGRIAFHTHALDQAYLFMVDGGSGGLSLLLGPVDWVHRVAISGDGGTVGYQVAPTGAEYPYTEIGVVGAAAGNPLLLVTDEYRSDGALELSDDGTKLLVGPAGLLIETAAGTVRDLAVRTPGGHEGGLITSELLRATMSADATRFLYVVAGPERNHLATLDAFAIDSELDPELLGAAPLIADPTIDPTEILFEGDPESIATASAAVELEGTLRFIGLVALRDGLPDENVRAWDDAGGAGLYDEGLDADAAAGDAVFTSGPIFHYPYQTRPDDTGPRTIRFQVEIEGPGGLLHGTALDLPDALTVVAE